MGLNTNNLAFATDSSGNITGLVGPGGRMLGITSGQGLGRAPIIGVGGSGLVAGDVAIVTGSPTVTIEPGPTGQMAIKVVTGVGTNAEIKFPGLIGAMAGGDAFLTVDGSYSTSNVDNITCYVSQDATGYAKGWANTIQYGFTAPVNNPKEQGSANSYFFKRANNSNFGSPTYPAYVADMKLRITPRAALAATVYIYAFGFADRFPKGRICVVWDDGYDSMFKLGYDSFASRGIKQTLSVIGSSQGTAGASNINQLRSFIGAGNALVTHGPWPNAGAGNLLTAYPGSTNPVSDAVADMVQNRNYLADNGLLVPGADVCYVWPQGVFQQAGGDLAILDAAIAAGFTFGRSASTSAYAWRADALPKYNRLATPIIGHTWAGTTATEATNITAIGTSISGLSTDRSDAMLMLHRVQPTTTADGSMSSIGIRHGDLETIAAAIKTGIDAGTLESVTMADLALSSRNVWGSF